MTKRNFCAVYLIKEVGNKTPKEMFVFEKYFKKLEDDKQENKKFGGTRHYSKYNIETLKDAEDPEHSLVALFEHAMFDAIMESKKYSIQSGKYRHYKFISQLGT